MTHPISTTIPERVFKDDNYECSVCMEEFKDTILGPCGHFCLCRSCCENLDKCPICREDVDCVSLVNYLISYCLDYAGDLIY